MLSGSAQILARAQQLITVHRYDDARTELQRGLANAPGDPALLTELANLELSVYADPRLCIAAAERAIRARPTDERNLRILALALRRSGRNAEALRAADEAVRLAPGLTETHVARAEALLAVGKLVDAHAAVDQALRMAPADRTALITRANIYLRQRKPRDAERILRSVLAEHPADSTALNNLGVALARQRRKREARELYARSSAANRHSPTARQNLVRSAGKIAIPLLAAVWYLGIQGLSNLNANGPLYVLETVVPILVAAWLILYVRRRRVLARLEPSVALYVRQELSFKRSWPRFWQRARDVVSGRARPRVSVVIAAGFIVVVTVFVVIGALTS